MDGCARCQDPSEYWRLDRVADDDERHAALFRCPDCESLYELFPEVKERPARLSLEDAARAFPGAL